MPLLFITHAGTKTSVDQPLVETCQICCLKTKTEGKPRPIFHPARLVPTGYAAGGAQKTWWITGSLSFLMFLLVSVENYITGSILDEHYSSINNSEMCLVLFPLTSMSKPRSLNRISRFVFVTW